MFQWRKRCLTDLIFKTGKVPRVVKLNKELQFWSVNFFLLFFSCHFIAPMMEHFVRKWRTLKTVKRILSVFLIENKFSSREKVLVITWRTTQTKNSHSAEIKQNRRLLLAFEFFGSKTNISYFDPSSSSVSIKKYKH